MERWVSNLSAAVALEPEHLSCYGLKVEPGTPLFARRVTAGLPDDEAQADMYLHTVEFLQNAGYGQYEISNFSKPGRESLHNLKYWTLGEYLGFGPGAHSDFGGERFACGRDLSAYLQGIRTRAPVLSEREQLTFADRASEWLMLGLRTTRGLAPTAFETTFHQPFSVFLPFLNQCRQAGYAVVEDGRWHLTPQGFLLSNQIIGGMLDALAAEKQRRADAAARGDFHIDSL
jgi:oxygen-independent coproporphyrinogen-3 oxidase